MNRLSDDSIYEESKICASFILPRFLLPMKLPYRVFTIPHPSLFKRQLFVLAAVAAIAL
jgi:hypothetical protein